MMDIISAGHDTSSNMMINGVAYLLDHPTHFARLRQQPSLVDVTVEELTLSRHLCMGRRKYGRTFPGRRSGTGNTEHRRG